MCGAAQDIAELEAAVAENLLPLEAVGAPHRALRAFRALLFAPTPALADSLLLPALPRSTVLHHLYSRAPPALQSPHSRSGFSPAQVCRPLSVLLWKHLGDWRMRLQARRLGAPCGIRNAWCESLNPVLMLLTISH